MCGLPLHNGLPLVFDVPNNQNADLLRIEATGFFINIVHLNEIAIGLCRRYSVYHRLENCSGLEIVQTWAGRSAANGRGCVKTQNPKNRVVNCYKFAWFTYSKVDLRGKPLAKNTFCGTIPH